MWFSRCTDLKNRGNGHGDEDTELSRMFPKSDLRGGGAPTPYRRLGQTPAEQRFRLSISSDPQ